MRHHHTGSGRRTVFSPDWQDAHAGVVAGTFTSLVTVGDPDAATEVFNATSGLTDVTPAGAVYFGAASIAMVSDPQLLQVVDEPDATSLYQVELPVDVDGVKPGHVVHVVASPDPVLVGRDLQVTGPQLGDRRWSRMLHAILNH
jgi:hypothetical protein